MIGYKASYNGKCQSLNYEVGKTYTLNGELKMCEQGFHFCKNSKDVLNYYKIENSKFQLFKVEALGEVIVCHHKSVTDKIKILEIIPKEQYRELLYCFYDENGNIVKKIDAAGDILQYEYNENDNLIKIIYPSERIHRYFYDDRNNLIKEISPDGGTYQYFYDKNNNKIKEIDYDGYICLYEYDDRNNLIKKFYPDGGTYQYFYDKNNLIKKFYLDGDLYQLEYDDKGNRIKQINPDKSSWTITIE